MSNTLEGTEPTLDEEKRETTAENTEPQLDDNERHLQQNDDGDDDDNVQQNAAQMDLSHLDDLTFFAGILDPPDPPIGATDVAHIPSPISLTVAGVARLPSSNDELEDDDDDKKPAAVNPSQEQSATPSNPLLSDERNYEGSFPIASISRAARLPARLENEVDDDEDDQKKEAAATLTKLANENLEANPAPSLPSSSVKRTSSTEDDDNSGGDEQLFYTEKSIDEVSSSDDDSSTIKYPDLAYDIPVEERERDIRQGGCKAETWHRHFQNLVDYRQRHGNCRVPQKYGKRHPRLGNWVNKIRQENNAKKEGRKNKGKTSALNEDRIRYLNAIGFDWGHRKGRRAFEDSIERLKKFKKKHQHCNVPTKYEEDTRLGRFVSTVRKQKKNDELSESQIEQLNSLNFEWTAQPGPKHGTKMPRDRGRKAITQKERKLLKRVHRRGGGSIIEEAGKQSIVASGAELRRARKSRRKQGVVESTTATATRRAKGGTTTTLLGKRKVQTTEEEEEEEENIKEEEEEEEQDLDPVHPPPDQDYDDGSNGDGGGDGSALPNLIEA